MAGSKPGTGETAPQRISESLAREEAEAVQVNATGNELRCVQCNGFVLPGNLSSVEYCLCQQCNLTRMVYSRLAKSVVGSDTAEEDRFLAQLTAPNNPKS